MKRILSILMACLFMVAVLAVMAVPAFASPKDAPHKNGAGFKVAHFTPSPNDQGVKKTGPRG